MFIFYFVYTKHQVSLIFNQNKDISVANFMIQYRFIFSWGSPPPPPTPQPQYALTLINPGYFGGWVAPGGGGGGGGDLGRGSRDAAKICIKVECDAGQKSNFYFWGLFFTSHWLSLQHWTDFYIAVYDNFQGLFFDFRGLSFAFRGQNRPELPCNFFPGAM